MTIRTTNGSRQVVTIEQDGVFTSRLYVNVSSNDQGDATLVSARHTTKAGALKWARKQLGA